MTAHNASRHGATRGGRGRTTPAYVRPLAGLATVAVLAAVVAFSVYLFRGGARETMPVTVLSPRAGLVMDPGAKVKLKGVEVGRVESIQSMPNGQAALHLAINSTKADLIPANVGVDIASPTVFGAKAVRLIPPPDPSPRTLQSGQILDADHVVVEVDTVFEKLTSTLAVIEPAKLNETLSAIQSALGGRGDKLGQSLSDLDEVLAKIDPSLPNLRHDIISAPVVTAAYADAATDLTATIAHTNTISQSIVDEQKNLDAFLVSAIGLSDIGTEVLDTNGGPLTNLVHLLVPTTDLTSRYHEALTCGLQAVVPFTKNPPNAEPGVMSDVGTVAGIERYRYPSNLPKVAAKGGSQCASQQIPNKDRPNPPPNFYAPFVVTDIGANPAQYSNPGPLLNFDGLKQLLFGPIDGPPRNTAQVGQPG